ncbi:MAG: ECF transporter S component [Ruminococcaceae bacterium]|nr:ECF transporter S component [Oscillospiraceae bacterium]
MKNKKLKTLSLAAMFLALGLVLPFLTGQLQKIGNMLLPMHFPVMLCGLICGWKYGLLVGFIMPLLRFVLFGMPKLYPTAVAMAFELATYGLVVGLLYARSPWKCTKSILKALLISMASGRIVWGVVQMILLRIENNAFTFGAFIGGALLNAIPGILLQLLIIPAIMVALHKAKLVPLLKKHDRKHSAND